MEPRDIGISRPGDATFRQVLVGDIAAHIAGNCVPSELGAKAIRYADEVIAALNAERAETPAPVAPPALSLAEEYDVVLPEADERGHYELQDAFIWKSTKRPGQYFHLAGAARLYFPSSEAAVRDLIDNRGKAKECKRPKAKAAEVVMPRERVVPVDYIVSTIYNEWCNQKSDNGSESLCNIIRKKVEQFTRAPTPAVDREAFAELVKAAKELRREGIHTGLASVVASRRLFAALARVESSPPPTPSEAERGWADLMALVRPSRKAFLFRRAEGDCDWIIEQREVMGRMSEVGWRDASLAAALEHAVAATKAPS